MMVSPFARVAAIITLSVPKTVEPNFPPRKISLPTRFALGMKTFPPCVCDSAPSSASPLRWMSIGRSPMEQPPGSEIVALPHRAIIGPSTQIEARILRTSSYGTSVITFSARVVTVPFSKLTFAPSWDRISSMKRMSDKSGTL
jgi:hypothetical protein